MVETRVAARYAQSIIELAEERGELDIVYQDMQLIAATLKASKELQHLLNSPIVANDKKLKILEAVFAGKTQEITATTFRVLTKKNREMTLPYLAQEFINQYQVKKGIVIATIKTVTALSPALKQSFVAALEQQITANKILLEEQVDENLIGGFILQVGDRQIDTSVMSALQKIKLNIQDSSYIVKF